MQQRASSAAADWARKRKEQQERAAELRASRVPTVRDLPPGPAPGNPASPCAGAFEGRRVAMPPSPQPGHPHQRKGGYHPHPAGTRWWGGAVGDFAVFV